MSAFKNLGDKISIIDFDGRDLPEDIDGNLGEGEARPDGHGEVSEAQAALKAAMYAYRRDGELSSDSDSDIGEETKAQPGAPVFIDAVVKTEAQPDTDTEQANRPEHEQGEGRSHDAGKGLRKTRDSSEDENENKGEEVDEDDDGRPQYVNLGNGDDEDFDEFQGFSAETEADLSAGVAPVTPVAVEEEKEEEEETPSLPPTPQVPADRLAPLTQGKINSIKAAMANFTLRARPGSAADSMAQKLAGLRLGDECLSAAAAPSASASASAFESASASPPKSVE